MERYFSYSPNGNGLEFHDTEEEARRAAEQSLEWERKEAGEGWDEQVGEICWGVIKQRAMRGEEYPAPEGSICDFHVDYTLQEPEQ